MSLSNRTGLGIQRHLFTSLGWVMALGAMAGSNILQTNNPSGLQIVTLRRNADLDGLAQEFGLKPRHVYRHALNGFAAPLNSATAQRLKQDARVLAVEPDGNAVLNDQSIPAGVLRMGISNFPMTRVNGRDNRIGVDVAVLDTGIQMDHPDLNVVQGVDCTGAGLNGADWHGHGTLMAGIIGALDNDLGIVGVAPGARLWAVQVFGPGTNFGSWSPILAGMDYIAANADSIAVVNASFSGPGPYEALHEAVSNIVSRGVVFVGSAGNDSVDIAGGDGVFGAGDDYMPASFSEVMAVSAMDPAGDTFADFSNFSRVPKSPSYVTSPGAGIDVAAPGVNILTTVLGSGYGFASGTSEACAHATGLVALYIAANGRATNAQGVYSIRQAIIDHSLPQSAWATAGKTGDPDGNPEPLAMTSEDWIPIPMILSESMSSEGFQLVFPAVPGYTYTPQFAGSLGESNHWAPLGSTNGSGSLSTVTVTDPTPDPTVRFYRLARQPSP